MDDRQREVQIGAGLQESRLNTELISFLQVWGPRVLYVLLAVVLVYIGMQYLERRRVEQLNEAFAMLDSAVDTETVQGLLDVADAHRGKHSVWTQANLFAGRVVITHLRLGFDDSQTPQGATEPVMMTDEEHISRINMMLPRLREVARENTEDKHALFAGEAYWSIASLLLSKADFVPGQRDQLLEEAKQALRSGSNATRESGLDAFADGFDSRYEALFGDDGVQIASNSIELPRNEQLPEVARRPARSTRPQSPQGPMIMGDDGRPVGMPLQVRPQGASGEIDAEELRRLIEGVEIPGRTPPGEPESTPEDAPSEPSSEPETPPTQPDPQ